MDLQPASRRHQPGEISGNDGVHAIADCEPPTPSNDMDSVSMFRLQMAQLAASFEQEWNGESGKRNMDKQTEKWASPEGFELAARYVRTHGSTADTLAAPAFPAWASALEAHVVPESLGHQRDSDEGSLDDSMEESPTPPLLSSPSPTEQWEALSPSNSDCETLPGVTASQEIPGESTTLFQQLCAMLDPTTRPVFCLADGTPDVRANAAARLMCNFTSLESKFDLGSRDRWQWVKHRTRKAGRRVADPPEINTDEDSDYFSRKRRNCNGDGSENAAQNLNGRTLRCYYGKPGKSENVAQETQKNRSEYFSEDLVEDSSNDHTEIHSPPEEDYCSSSTPHTRQSGRCSTSKQHWISNRIQQDVDENGYASDEDGLESGEDEFGSDADGFASDEAGFDSDEAEYEDPGSEGTLGDYLSRAPSLSGVSVADTDLSNYHFSEGLSPVGYLTDDACADNVLEEGLSRPSLCTAESSMTTGIPNSGR